MGGVSPGIAGHFSFWAFDSTFGSGQIHRDRPRHICECQLLGRTQPAYSELSELGLHDRGMREYIVTFGMVFLSITFMFTPSIVMDIAITLKTVTVHFNSVPHVVRYDLGVRVRTLGLLCDEDVLKGRNVPVVSNLCQVADVALEVLALSPTFLKADDPRADYDVNDSTSPKNEADNHIAHMEVHLQLFSFK